MSQLQIGRLTLGPAWTWHEAIGDPITNLGGAPIPAPRQAIRHQVAIGTMAPDGPLDTVATRLGLRRQLRSMFNNTPLKIQSFFYVQYSDDLEQNGWYMPDFGQLADIDASIGLATGIWKLDNVAWLVAGHKRTHREARNVWMKDLRTGLPWRDTLKLIFSTDFVNLPNIPITSLPPGAISIANAVNGFVAGTAVLLPAGRDGGQCVQCAGPIAGNANNFNPDLACLAFDRTDANQILGDVTVKDRRGNTTGPFYRANVLQDNSVSYWRLDETSGTAATDLMGAHNGTYSGGFTLNQTGALVGGSDNDASALLNGTTGNMSVPFSSSLNAAPISWEIWCKPTQITGTFPNGGISMCVMGTNSDSSSTGLRVYISAGQWVLQVGTGTISINHNLTTNNPVVGQWAHVVLTHDGAVARLYVNGQLAYSVVTSYSPVTSGSLFLGRDLPGSFFSGNLDEAAVYAYTLNPQQIANHYAAGVCYDGGNQWEEAYGPDHDWSWLHPGAAADCPVIENGLTRVRWDSTNIPGFRVDTWDSNGATTNGSPGWAEQGKMTVQRKGDTTNLDDTWVAAGIHTEDGYTFDRATLAAVMSVSADFYSRERIFITMNRGQYGMTFECYPALKSNGTSPSDVALVWQPFPTGGTVDNNSSVLKIDGQGSWSGGSANSGTWTPSSSAATQTGSPSPGKFVATAGLSSALFSSQNVGAGNFTASENWAALLRCDTDIKTVYPWQVTFTTQQAANSICSVGNSANAYGGASDNLVQIASQNGAGYVSVDLGFTPATSQQVLEGELMTLGAGTSVGGDSSASNAQAAQNSQTADTNPVVTQANWPNSFLAQYRVFARVRVVGTQAKFYAKTGATTGTTVTVGGPTTPVYQWVDLGEILANNSTLEIHGWISSGTGSVDIDRIEAVLTQDRTRNSAIYSGARDNGLQELFDSRTMGTVVAR